MLGDGLSAIGILYILICMLRGGAALYQICIGVFISSVFSSLLEPAYRATVTDLLTKEEYSKASGMVSLAGAPVPWSLPCWRDSCWLSAILNCC